MEALMVKIINYIYLLGTLAFVAEYVISREKGDALALKLIDWSDFLSTKNVDKLISRISLYLSEKYDKVYGKKYFGTREWVISSVIAFTYCYLFYLAEKGIGFDSTLAKQLGYWFVPNLVADIISINFTRLILAKVYRHPGKYMLYLFYDLVVFAVCFYISFSFTMIYLTLFSEYSSARILLHPFYVCATAVQSYPDPIGIDALLIVFIASTVLLPTLLHVCFTLFTLCVKFSIPLLRFFTHSLIEKMISFERHPIGMAVIICGIFLMPFVMVFDLIV